VLIGHLAVASDDAFELVAAQLALLLALAQQGADEQDERDDDGDGDGDGDDGDDYNEEGLHDVCNTRRLQRASRPAPRR